jgi:alkyl hydroperoxide reductase subunit AhpC
MNVPRDNGGLGEKLQIPIIADKTKRIARDYGVLLEELGFALRGLFIIDTEGIIRHISMNDLPVGRSVDEVLRLVEAFQHVDKFGEVCPSDWKSGGRGIVPGVKESKEYFGSIKKD